MRNGANFSAILKQQTAENSSLHEVFVDLEKRNETAMFTDWIRYIVTLDFSASRLAFFPVFPSRGRMS